MYKSLLYSLLSEYHVERSRCFLAIILMVSSPKLCIIHVNTTLCRFLVDCHPNLQRSPASLKLEPFLTVLAPERPALFSL